MNEPENQTMHAQNVEYYAASVNAWFATRLEHDKSLLVLSTGGVGVLVTLLTTRGAETLLAIALYVLSLSCFLASLIAVLLVFQKNADHILAILQEREDLGDGILDRLDAVARCAFAGGVAFAVALGIVTAYGLYQNNEKERAKEMATQKQVKGVIASDSVSGAASLRPQALSQKSFSGAAALQPKASVQQPTAEAPTGSTAAASASAPAPASSPAHSTSK